MSRHRRRKSAGLLRHRRVGVFLITASVATAAVVTCALIVIVGSSGGSSRDPLAMAVAGVATGKWGSKIENERVELILQNYAAQKFTVTTRPTITAHGSPGTSGSPIVPSGPPPDPSSAEGIAYGLLSSFGFSTDQFGCLNDIWSRESGWRYNAENPDGAYGIPQALPGSKMASAGPNWQTDPTTQIKWGLGYIQSRYGTPCDAWAYWQVHDSY